MRLGSLSANLLLNIGSQLFLRAVTAGTAFYAARVLGPKEFGTWALLQTIFLFTAQGHLGVANAMMREIPFALAKGKIMEAEHLASSTLSLITILSFGIAVVACLPVCIGEWVPSPKGPVIVGVVWLAIVQLQSVFLQFYCRAYSRFKVMALCSAIQGIVTIGLCALLVSRLRIVGYLYAVASGFSVVPFAIWTQSQIHFRFVAAEWKRLLHVGVPILSVSVLLYLSASLERVVLGLGADTVLIGTFVVGAFAFQIGCSVWELVIYTLYAKLAHLYARRNDLSDLSSFLRSTLPSLILGSSMLQGFAYLILPWVFTKLLPAYQRSIYVAQILVLLLNVWGVAQMLNYSLTIIGRQQMAIRCQGTFILCKACLLWAAAACGLKLIAVCVATGVSLVVYAAVSWHGWSRLTEGGVGHLRVCALLWSLPTGLAIACSRIGNVKLGAMSNACPMIFYCMAVSGICWFLRRQIRTCRDTVASA